MIMPKMFLSARPVKFKKNANTEKSVNIMNMLLQRKRAPVARLKKSVRAQKPGALSSVMCDKMILI